MEWKDNIRVDGKKFKLIKPELKIGDEIIFHHIKGKVIKDEHQMEFSSKNKSEFCVIELNEPDENNCKIVAIEKCHFYSYMDNE